MDDPSRIKIPVIRLTHFYDLKGKEKTVEQPFSAEETIVTYVMNGDLLRVLFPCETMGASLSQQNMQIKMTKNYIVLNCNSLILYFKISELDEIYE